MPETNRRSNNYGRYEPYEAKDNSALERAKAILSRRRVIIAEIGNNKFNVHFPNGHSRFNLELVDIIRLALR